MGAAAYNRGNRILRMEADDAMPVPNARAERQAHKDEIQRLRERVARLEGDLQRAKRCLAAERHGREQLRIRLATAEREHEFGVLILCRLAFPGDQSECGGKPRKERG